MKEVAKLTPNGPLDRVSTKSPTTHVTNSSRALPVSKLLVMSGRMIGQSVSVLKDDGCNTNVLSTHFVNKHAHQLQIQKASFQILHSKRNTTEQASQLVVNATVHLGGHKYTSNWAVADANYDILLGMPWHIDMKPVVNYETRKVSVAGQLLPVRCVPDDSEIRVTNIGVKKFRSLLRRRSRQSYQVFRVSPAQVNQLTGLSKSMEKRVLLNHDDELQAKELLKKYDEVFRDELPNGLPPCRSVDHAIEIEGVHKPPYRSLYQLSPAELVAMKNYIVGLLKSGKIRPSKSPYGAPLFL